MFDRETIYRWLSEKNWEELLNFIHKNPQAAISDEIIQNAIQIFTRQFVDEVESGSNDPNFSRYLEKIILLRKTGKFQIPDEHYEVLIIELIKRNKHNLQEAYNYAKLYPDHEVCVAVIKEYTDSIPKPMQHSQSDQIRVTENSEVADVDYTISLFKSQQEHEFYRAVVELFPNHAVYPNVALSCLIDFQQIEHQLTSEEKKFFFSGIVDCVVFDIFKAHKPIRFFELDSIHHESQYQSVKDKYKDKILAVAGQKLYRIRRMSKGVSQAKFVKLIREVLSDKA